ncbi:uncharacterized protein K02A2.6-like [Toxorhynchites rutilus septentrionalis]|uniref:uncharacterized protein K02A2.6-like n=1 Tax=Toxorhynchites rutilus septentrionalis TaxID=329112 RepID=UPI00247AF2F2|nr:uncharacterized protein K02A2.6-like [Toxorhynchites rutilus septentrionalis]
MKQMEGERFAEFIIRIRQQIGECGVDRYDPEVREILTDIMLVDTIVEEELRKQIFQKDRTVEEIEQIGRSLEGVLKQLKDFGAIREEVKYGERVFDIHHAKRKSRYQQTKPNNSVESRLKSKSADLKCFKCGFYGHISTDSRCPARGKWCKRCKKMGHFESRCRWQNRPSFGCKENMREHSSETKKIRIVDQTSPVRESNAVEVIVPLANDSQKTYYAFYSGNVSNVIVCKIGGVLHPMLVDSGADANLITDTAWNSFKSAGICVSSCVKGSNRILKSYANSIPLTVLGSFKAVVCVGAESVEAEFFVIKGGQRSLLGDKTAKALGILKVGLDIDQVTKKVEPLSKIKDVSVHIHLDAEIKPVFQPMRRVPVALEEAVNHKLSEWMERDIIEEKKGPVTWVSPLVVVGKANGEPRICLDLRRVNEAVLRERHPMPLIDDFLARIGSNMIRSKLDVKDSFLQIELDETSRDAMVFLTPRGLYRFKRMPFGLVTAPEIFQRTMDEILVGCEGTWWYIDDIYIEGKNKYEHDDRVAKVE